MTLGRKEITNERRRKITKEIRKEGKMDGSIAE